jgi:hypothetical protein
METRPQPSGLALPTPFPDALFEAVKNRVVVRMPSSTSERANFAGGHNGVRFRLRACADYSEEFIESVRRSGDAPPLEDRYQQERQLFGFFVSGIAALDCFNFLIHFTAAHLRPNCFPTQKASDIRAIARKSTAKAFSRQFPGEAITIALNSLVTDSQLQQWDCFRNILAHRSAPGRVVYASLGSHCPDPAAVWRIDPTANLTIDANLTPPRLDWLVTKLADLVVAADQFPQTYF